ncbi:MAG TPA: sigma-70 family RNA polymerase sigma factor [Bryobacteraceae bacterium]|nr:sigma-70 family RNA polymerase sigma factor [Bryobacteraceae bacterium]
MGACLSTDRAADYMLAFQAGDVASFNRIVEEYHHMVVGYLYRFVRNHAVAEELTQEVFLRVYRVRNYEPTAKFQTWLFRIVTHLALNWVRDQRAERAWLRLDERPLDVRPYELRSGALSMEDWLVHQCTLDEVRSAIEQLPERHRTAVWMHKYREMEYREIAEELGCSVPALKSLLFRAYETLRERLAHLS